MNLSLELKNSEELKNKISLSGYSINGFAKLIKVSPSYLSKVVKGEQKPYPQFAKKIADGLNLKISDIFFASNGCKK